MYVTEVRCDVCGGLIGIDNQPRPTHIRLYRQANGEPRLPETIKNTVDLCPTCISRLIHKSVREMMGM